MSRVLGEHSASHLDIEIASERQVNESFDSEPMCISPQPLYYNTSKLNPERASMRAQEIASPTQMKRKCIMD